jgi:hypothetical protein
MCSCKGKVIVSNNHRMIFNIGKINNFQVSERPVDGGHTHWQYNLETDKGRIVIMETSNKRIFGRAIETGGDVTVYPALMPPPLGYTLDSSSMTGTGGWKTSTFDINYINAVIHYDKNGNKRILPSTAGFWVFVDKKQIV